jgi:putative IMPACT (imprinted ancient) family translation regulator
MAPHIPVTFTLDYSHYGKVDNYVNVSGLTKEDVRFGAGVEMVLVLPEDQGDFVIAQIMDLTGGNAAVKKGSAEYRAMAIR